jgi:hypothetical protein
MNQPHPAKVVPSAHGDSVGHYEGDTLVIDTVGVKVGPYTMIDRLGTPYTEALHVVERYRLIDYEAAVEAQARGFKEWTHIPAYDVDPITRARDCSSNSQSRMKASSLCRGKASSRIGAPCGNFGMNASARKT